MKSLVQHFRNHIATAKNRKLREGQLEREWQQALSRHSIALAEHKAACERYHANPSKENEQETWRCYELTWERFNEQFEIWRQVIGLR